MYDGFLKRKSEWSKVHSDESGYPKPEALARFEQSEPNFLVLPAGVWVQFVRSDSNSLRHTARLWLDLNSQNQISPFFRLEFGFSLIAPNIFSNSIRLGLDLGSVCPFRLQFTSPYIFYASKLRHFGFILYYDDKI